MEAAFNFKDSSFLVAAGGGGGDFGRGGVEGEEEGEGGLVCSVFASVDGVFLFDLSLEILLAAGVDFDFFLRCSGGDGERLDDTSVFIFFDET